MRKSRLKQSSYPRLRKASLVAVFAGMLLITVLMGLRFYLMLYYPGTPKTLGLFKNLLPYWGSFTQVILVLRSPMDLAASLLMPYMQSVNAWFPEMSAYALMAKLNSVADPATLEEQYPGKVEWLTLVAIPFWQAFLMMSHAFFWTGVETIIPTTMQLLDKKKAQPEKQAPPPQQQAPKSDNGPLFGLNLPKKEFVPPPAPQEAESRETVDPKILQRLSNSKNLSLNPPVNRPTPVREYTQADWEEYKQEEGDMMVRHMIRELQHENRTLQTQQQQLRSTFSQYFSPSVAQYLESNRGAFENIENQRHMVSVIFCDIRGFSKYSQSASDDDLVRFLGEYFEIASYFILHRYHGVINKLMGDGIMAYWGFPVPNDDHAYVATRAALDILKEVHFRNHTRPDSVPLNIGIGIATGEAIVGNIGSSDFKDFTLLGVPVNMAARLEEMNKQLNTSLLISQNTFQALKGRIPCQDFGEVDLRNWQGPERVYGPKIEKPSY